MGMNIEKELISAGYKMLGGDNQDKLILEILKTGNIRYLKAIPFLIYLYDLNIDRIYKQTSNKKLFENILAITKKIFEQEGIKKEIKFEDIGKLNYSEFKEEFELQKRNINKRESIIDKEKIYAERNLEMQLSLIFTPKEKEIIKKILNDKFLTKTEREYYSRKTKKKLNALIGLYEFALAILPEKIKC